MVAYCRVSTKQEEQLNSYETQVKHYTEKIRSEPKWKLVEIFADKGITGTSVKNRDEFNKMIRLCKKKKVDMIITKSISRFARNTLDCLKYTRLLKSLGVDVFFEEQGIHSMDSGAEFYITIYGSIAQSESLGSKGVKRIHLFASIPIAFAIGIGQAYNTNYDPEIITYDFNQGVYTKALTIGEK